MNYEQAFEEGVIVYENEVVYAVMPKDGACIGHTIVYSKQAKRFYELSDEEVDLLMYTASYASTMLYEGLKAQGTNIIMQDGKAADGEDQVAVHVFPRFENDGLDFMWEPKEADQAAIKASGEKIADNNHLIGAKVSVSDDDDVPPPISEDHDYDTVRDALQRFP